MSVLAAASAGDAAQLIQLLKHAGATGIDAAMLLNGVSE